MNKNGVMSEDLFLELFSDVFGADKTNKLYPQFQFEDIYQNKRFADFVFNKDGKRVAVEIDGQAVHDKRVVSDSKFDDDQLKQNSMIYSGWDVYRWSYNKLLRSPETVKDEMKVFLGDSAGISAVEDYLPKQKTAQIEDRKDFTLKEHQVSALAELEKLRNENVTIALVNHATGTGKTVLAVMDSQKVGGRTLFIAHTKELVGQASKKFAELDKERTVGLYYDGHKENSQDIICGSVQSVALDLSEFHRDEFDYIIIDEAHHAESETYRKIISYFNPRFLLGLTATPERADGKDILELFGNIAHRLSLEDAVKQGELVPIRCFRTKTNIDISNVRFNGIKYNSQDLEKLLYVPERNKIIVDTYMQYAQKKHTVIFCVSVKHAEEIERLLISEGINARSVSGNLSTTDRNEILANYEDGRIQVLCACDLLNEGWDSPKTEMLFMARPTMSKVIYTQQLGRGTRLSPGKEHLVVFDFVDNANMFNAPHTLHRLAGVKEYKPGAMIMGGDAAMQADQDLYRRGEKPEVFVDFPISVKDYEMIDIFNWQEEAEGMKSQMQFVQMVDVQNGTIDSYIRQGKIKPDLVIPMARTMRLFKEESIYAYAKEFGWQIITNKNKKDLFLKMVQDMTMSYSYKPILLKGILKLMDKNGRVSLENLAEYFIEFYVLREKAGKVIEKSDSIFSKTGYTKSDVIKNILANPFKRFEEMNMMSHTKELGIIRLDGVIINKLTRTEKEEIQEICDTKLENYYKRIAR